MGAPLQWEQQGRTRMNARHLLPSGERSVRRRLLAIDFATADVATIGEAISVILEETSLGTDDRVHISSNLNLSSLPVESRGTRSGASQW